MSRHLVSCAGRVQVKPAHKLLLLCLADNARDDDVRHASPGIEEAMQWTGRSSSTVSELTKDLIELGLLRLHRRGQKHVGRAVYVVFPDGCCEVHGLALTLDLDDEDHQPGGSRRALSEAQLEVRRKNSRQIAERRRAERTSVSEASDPEQVSASDAGNAEDPVDNPGLRTLREPQHPNSSDSASENEISASDRSDAFLTTELPEQPPEHSPHSDHSPAREPAASAAATVQVLTTVCRANGAATWTEYDVGLVHSRIASNLGGGAQADVDAAAMLERLSQRPKPIRSLANWAGSLTDEHLMAQVAGRAKAKAEPGCDSCTGGWRGEDDDGRPIPCPRCRPHAVKAVA